MEVALEAVPCSTRWPNYAEGLVLRSDKSDNFAGIGKDLYLWYFMYDLGAKSTWQFSG